MKKQIPTKKKVSSLSKPTVAGDSKIAARSTVDFEKVRCRAYEIYEQRCRECLPGDPISDWVRAEDEVRIDPS